MSQARLTISYDGPALRDGAMDVRDLAPALLAVGRLFDAANSLLNKDEVHIRVDVKATSASCFEIDLQVVQNLSSHIISIISGEDIRTATGITHLIIGSLGVGGICGLISLTVKLRGRLPSRVEKIDQNIVKIQIDDDTLEVPLETLRLYQDIAVRSAAQQLIEEPLKRDGIDIFRISDDRRFDDVVVTKEEAAYFRKPQVEEQEIVRDRRISAFAIISLAFKEDNKWRLSDGSSPISARIEDQDFLRRVDNNQVAFAKGDILICEVLIKQFQSSSGLKTEYIVEKVIEHRPAMRQLRLL